MEEQKKKKIIGNYQLCTLISSEKTLGEGTFGKVKLAIHIPSQQKVAIKILEKERIIEVADVERVSRQIHILKIIRHPNLIQLYEIIQTPKQLFLVMEFANSGQLFDHIVSNKKLKEVQACQIFQQLISGIDYIHKLNIVHRDLKPQNLLIDFNKTLKIIDFGLSNTFRKGIPLSSDEMVKTGCGSPCYAAPEMIEGLKYFGPKVDIWSCGVILFAMVAGYLPFEDQNTGKLYQKILKCDYVVPKFLSVDLKDLLSKLLVIDPQKRIKTEQIKQHKWWHLYQPTFENQGIIVGYNRIPYDEKILKMLPELGFDQDYAQKCIQANRHNSTTTCYYLLLKNYIRQGNKSNADMINPNFDLSLIEPLKRRTKGKINNFTNNEFLEIDKNVGYNKRNPSLPRSRVGSTGQSTCYEAGKPLKTEEKDLMMLGKNEIKIDLTKAKKQLTNGVKQLFPSKTPNTTKQIERKNRYKEPSPNNNNNNKIKKNYKLNFNESFMSKSRERKNSENKDGYIQKGKKHSFHRERMRSDKGNKNQFKNSFHQYYNKKDNSVHFKFAK